MPYQPNTNYDAANKIWRSEKERSQFGEDLSIGELTFQEMHRHPGDIAQISVSENTVLLRRDLVKNAMRIATFMRRLDLTQSDIVGFIARNTTHAAAVAYACFFNGIALHSLNPSYVQDIIKKLFHITKPRLIFCDGDEYEKIRNATAKLNVRIVTMRNHPAGAITIQEVLQTPVAEGFQPARLERRNSQALAILSTSGTTGTPKAVIVTNNRTILNGYTKLTTSDVQFATSSVDWLTGLMTLVSAGVFSTKRIVSDEPVHPREILRIIEHYQVTWVFQSPGQLAAIVNCPEFEKANLQSLRYYYYGGGRCTMEVQNRLHSKLGRDCMNFAYGLSETGSLVSLNWHYVEKPNSVGRPSSGCEVKIIDEQGQNLGPNEEGEVCINLGIPCPGYYGNPEATKQVYKDKFIHTGDLGYVDDDGFLFIVERKKDLLKYQSNKYYPHELEELISRIPGVIEICAFGIWNMENGDEAAAMVARRPDVNLGEEDVVNYVAKHSKAKFLRLHSGCLILDQLKRSPNGKTNRVANKVHYIQAKGIRLII